MTRSGTPAEDETAPLRVVVCGSVDDGKSTLIGRLLYDAGTFSADQLDRLATDSARFGTRGDALDLALVLDGLSAEREQGITIDVAHREFATARRRFLFADAPGHEEYVRSMVTGASTADAAILVVDARKGVSATTRLHARLLQVFGIGTTILAVNKLDLFAFDQHRFTELARDFADLATAIGLDGTTAIPVSGLDGDNLAVRSRRAAWYSGPTLVEVLEAAPVATATGSFRMPVQWVSRDGASAFRGYAGQIASGSVRPGDAIRVLPTGHAARIGRIVTMDGDRDSAGLDQSVMLTLVDEIACSRGDVIVAADDAPQVADQFQATLVWLTRDDLLPGRTYRLKLATQTVNATVETPKCRLSTDGGEPLAASTLSMNAIGVANLSTDRSIVFAPFAENRTLGGFILIDRLTNATVAAGMLRFALRRAGNVRPQSYEISRDTRAAALGQRPKVLWFTGLSGAGKSTIANLVDKALAVRGLHTTLLDGDNVRGGLCRDLGFTDADRVENMRRVGEVARLMTDAGLIVIVALISPFRAEREMVRAMIAPGEFAEIHVDCALAEAERRDPKGLYAKARRGELPNFTGIDGVYEAPDRPELRIDTEALSPTEAATLVIDRIFGEGGAADESKSG